MKKTIKIKVDAFRTPKDEPTCSMGGYADETCDFLAFKKFGTRPVCRFLDEELDRGDNGIGFLIPDCNCPIWRESK